MVSRFRVLAFSVVAASAAPLAAPVSAQSSQEPLPRFEEQICPGVAGLQLEAAEAVVGRIRANLAEFGRSLAPESTCEPNLVVAFVEDNREFLRQMERERRWLFLEMDEADRRALLDDPGSTRTLLRVRSRSRDGMPVGRRENLVDIPQTTMWMAHSKIYTATRNDIHYAMVLFDREAIAGLNLAQLADYATFRALTRTLPQTSAARRASILALFEDGAERPEGLTDFDRSYLSTLYSGPPNLPGPNRQAAIEAATGRDIFE